jgi:hypothetical protein
MLEHSDDELERILSEQYTWRLTEAVEAFERENGPLEQVRVNLEELLKDYRTVLADYIRISAFVDDALSHFPRLLSWIRVNAGKLKTASAETQERWKKDPELHFISQEKLDVFVQYGIRPAAIFDGIQSFCGALERLVAKKRLTNRGLQFFLRKQPIPSAEYSLDGGSVEQFVRRELRMTMGTSMHVPQNTAFLADCIIGFMLETVAPAVLANNDTETALLRELNLFSVYKEQS